MKPSSDEVGEAIWMNGVFTALDACRISPLDRGFLYGDGLFETLRAEKGRILSLSAHISRLLQSMADLRLGTGRLPDWDLVLPELLVRNGLDQKTAAVKILVTRGLSDGMGIPATELPTVLIHAREYHPPTEREYSRGWRLITFRSGFAPPLAMHKSLNYLFYMTARQAALDAGADEAVVLDPWGGLSETAAGSLLLRSEGHWWTPTSRYQLPGVTIRKISEQMRHMGWEIVKREATVPDLFTAETIYVLNSLMLIMPVETVDGHAVSQPSPEHAELLRERLLQSG